MTRRSTPARRTRPVQATAGTETGGVVEVRLIGRETAVRRFVEALTAAAGPSRSTPVAYRPTRDGDGVRAYVTLALPEDDA
ncbi:hypothetical protein [Streptomyces sp. CAI-85]|uniref:hypothetical protein n=1 Tax=Streptomyces sp. CAI-85 TaxID=1472662 RepID=UPI0015870ABE|nr:hypothetical protein [Streptomyces sp. CAI-85]NUV64301.1 hypothetical protein [Streptomyces sp. CAI-85]